MTILHAMSANPHPPLLYPDYKSTRTRAPRQPLVPVAADAAELSGPMFTRSSVSIDVDLTRQSTGEPLGEKIVVAGRVLDSGGRPVRDSLVELWQSNAAGRYTDDSPTRRGGCWSSRSRSHRGAGTSSTCTFDPRSSTACR